MSERATGISTRSADEWVATFVASEQAGGRDRVVQIISTTAGKIDQAVGPATRTVSVDDSVGITSVSGTLIGDNAYLGVYVKHSESDGSCLITPLLCDDNHNVVGTLDTKQSKVGLPLASGSHYLANVLSWEILDAGAWRTYMHVYSLSDSNTVDIWAFTF